MRGAYASRTGSRASAGASAKKMWKSSILSCKERLCSQSAATTASHTALVMCLVKEVGVIWLCSARLEGCKQVCQRCAPCQPQRHLLLSHQRTLAQT